MTSDLQAPVASLHAVPLTPHEDALLRALARALVTLPRMLEEDLLRGQRMSASEYFALMHLSEAPGWRLRMSELAAAAALSLSGMTRIVQRLAASDLVRRERSSEDGRGWYAVLTDSGLQRLQQAWPTHLASVRRHVFDHLDAVDLPAVTAALERMAAALEVRSPGTCDGDGDGDGDDKNADAARSPAGSPE